MKNHVVCLYDVSGLAGMEWAKAGYEVFCYDKESVGETITQVGKGRVHKIHWDATDQEQNTAIIDRHLGQTIFTMAFPPCTDLAVSGAAHFAVKYCADSKYREKALALVYAANTIATTLSAPFFIENPVSVISTQWRRPDYIFSPYYFGGYLPEDDIHPEFPQYIQPRDAYTKKTCYWTGNGFVLPEKKIVPVYPGYSKQHTQLGGKSKRTKYIRSLSPRGIARAIFLHYGE